MKRQREWFFCGASPALASARASGGPREAIPPERTPPPSAESMSEAPVVSSEGSANDTENITAEDEPREACSARLEVISGGGGDPRERRFMAVVFPELLAELAVQRSPREASRPSPRAIVLCLGKGGAGEDAVGKGSGGDAASHWAGEGSPSLEPTTRLDAVNSAARRLGVLPRQSIAHATAIAPSLSVVALPAAHVSHTLLEFAEAALGFGTPVSFEMPDTVWVDVTGTRHLFGGERELAVALSAHFRALGHSVRLACAAGPWLAQAFARHADFDETGICLVDDRRVGPLSGLLPIAALPIDSDTVSWFSRLGLLNLDDLRRLPPSTLASRLATPRTKGPGVERILELIQGRDDGVLVVHVPEQLPFEEQSWDFPLENIEPLLFVSKGLSARLGSRLEGRGQAARELSLTIRYDRASVDLLSRHAPQPARASVPSATPRRGRPGERSVSATSGASAPLARSREIIIRLASPLTHAEDLERIVRARLQKETLPAPASSLRLQVTAITEARQWQLGLKADTGLGASLSEDPRTMTVLMAELSADIGIEAVGVLETLDSHLLEKSTSFVPIRLANAQPRRFGARELPTPAPAVGHSPPGAESSKLPTRLITPLEIDAPLEPEAVIVIDQRAFVIESVAFEQRLEAVEWWAPAPVSRDYFRLWLQLLSQSLLSSQSSSQSSLSQISSSRNMALSIAGRREGLEVLVYVNRNDGKKYIQALYD